MIAKVTVMNKILEQALLYDFYGESEIAEGAGISRQGVHDLIRRCQKALEGYEAKLHLVERFLSVREKVGEIGDVLDEWEENRENPEEIVGRIRKISDAIIEEL